MLGPYRRVLRLPGAWQFSLTGFIARIPWSMVALGIVVFISTTTGSYAQAGVLSACFQIAASIGAVATSRWSDRLGQARLLPWVVMVNAAFLIGFVACVELGLPLIVQAVTVAVAGAAQPAIGSMVRARWARTVSDPADLRSAFALESIVDEVVFTAGPLLVAVLAFQVALPAPIVVGALVGLVGGIALAAQRRSQPEPSARAAHADQRGVGAMRQPGLLLLVVGALGIGAVFGSYEVAVVAFCEDKGSPSASGVVLALWAFGSLVGGLVFGARPWQAPLPRQVVVLAGCLALVLVPTPFIGGVGVLAVATLFAGAAVAPALIANFSLTERLVPPALLTEGLTWTNSGLALGFAGGSSLGGIVIDSYGTTVAFCLPIAGAAFACAVVAVGQPVLRRAMSRSSSAARPDSTPTAPLNAEPVPGPAPGGIPDDPANGGAVRL